MSSPTAFTLPEAVDVWDAEFRWRDGRRLRDLTIDDTWRRIAEQAAAVESSQRNVWSFHFIDGFSRWRLLPAEDILRTFGTGRPMPALTEPGAVLNVAAFVVKQPVADARFDSERFVAIASLAVRFLDDVAAATGTEPKPRRLRIGLIGLADALDALGLDYDSAPARKHGASVARALAEGCLRGSVELAADRGRCVPLEDCLARAPLMRARGMPEWLVERALRVGLCHDALTALDPHPSLARLANGVCDAIDPLPAQADAMPDHHGVFR